MATAVKLGLLGLGAADKQCRNLLFEQHWFNADSSRSLREFPEVTSDLRLCVAFNGQKNCCQTGLEHEQALHFAYWRQILLGKIVRVRQAKMATLEVKDDPAFQERETDRDQFFSAVQKYKEVLEPSVHGRCFSALLVYAAGMICFSCDAQWRQSVHRPETGAVPSSSASVLRVRIPAGDCVELWAECSALGQKSRALREAILDSRLAMRSRLPVEYLEMFEDQQALCDWAHDVIAMHPFTSPNEVEKEATPPVSMRRLQTETTLHESLERDNLSFIREYDVMNQGRASRFDTSWKGSHSAHSGSRGLSVAMAICAICWAIWQAPVAGEKESRGHGMATGTDTCLRLLGIGA
ncbi:unnamed protein product [Effrenium voratum]|uniref:Uncharacterized protein n=1 Tax=Effrenium voratum TaxID=2562239 RepID=A0AA36N356_9DINO|nr:unnamed protein product [Effrenium voratum]